MENEELVLEQTKEVENEGTELDLVEDEANEVDIYEDETEPEIEDNTLQKGMITGAAVATAVIGGGYLVAKKGIPLAKKGFNKGKEKLKELKQKIADKTKKNEDSDVIDADIVETEDKEK